MRQRINITVSPEFHDELQRIGKDYSFINLCEMGTALLAAFAAHVKHAESRKGHTPESNEDQIRQMFAEFTDWEPTPSNGAVPQRRHNLDPDKILAREPAAPVDGEPP